MRIGNIELDSPVVLAPMAGISDLPYRVICRKFGCGLTVSEMVSAKGLLYKNEKTFAMLQIGEAERPTAIQLFGSVPEELAEAAKIVEARGADIVDFNMGCPVPKVVNNGEGSAMMKNVKLAAEVVNAMVKAVKKPVTVKIRKGFAAGDANAPEFAKAMEEAGAAAIAVHGRTREQYYSGKADWDIIAAVKQNVSIPVIGNGDIFTPQDAERMLKYTGCDGIMVARGAQGNPWIFSSIKEYLYLKGLIDKESCNYEISEQCRPTEKEGYNLSVCKNDLEKSDEKEKTNMIGKPGFDEVYTMIARHLDMLTKLKGEWTAVREMRSHIAWYTEGFPYSAGLRREINQCQSQQEILEYLSDYGERLKNGKNIHSF